MAGILYGLASVVEMVLNMVMVLIFISVFISWFSADPSNPYVRMVHSLTEPLYRPFRRLTSRIGGPFDFAPFIVLLIIVFFLKAIQWYVHTLALGVP